MLSNLCLMPSKNMLSGNVRGRSILMASTKTNENGKNYSKNHLSFLFIRSFKYVCVYDIKCFYDASTLRCGDGQLIGSSFAKNLRLT